MRWMTETSSGKPETESVRLPVGRLATWTIPIRPARAVDEVPGVLVCAARSATRRTWRRKVGGGGSTLADAGRTDEDTTDERAPGNSRQLSPLMSSPRLYSLRREMMILADANRSRPILRAVRVVWLWCERRDCWIRALAWVGQGPPPSSPPSTSIASQRLPPLQRSSSFGRSLSPSPYHQLSFAISRPVTRHERTASSGSAPAVSCGSSSG